MKEYDGFEERMTIEELLVFHAFFAKRMMENEMKDVEKEIIRRVKDERSCND